MWRVKSGMDRDIKRAYIKDLCLQTAPPTMRKTYGVLLISDRGANKDTPENRVPIAIPIMQRPGSSTHERFHEDQ